MVEVKVLGTGCAKCNKLYEEAKKGAAQSGVEVDLGKVESLDEIASYGVTKTPALVVSGQVKSMGKIPKSDQIAEWVKAASK